MAVSPETLAALSARIGYTFHNPSLLREALTHPSYLQQDPTVTSSNQRLEFLGDAVLQLILTEVLFQRYPQEREGVLSKRRSALSKGMFLSQLARDVGLESSLLVSDSEDQAGGRQRDAALEDAFESLIGAIYLDSDLTTTRNVVLGLYGSLEDRLSIHEHVDNPKGRLQERVQPLHGNDALRYEVTATLGVAHDREFEVELFLNDRSLSRGRGRSKKMAEEEAARIALANWSNDSL